jgi:peptide deformylase
MALLNILEFPDPRLRLRARPVEHFDKRLEQVTRDMLATMYDAYGIGLAATQVDIQQAIIVLDVSENADQPMTFINPKILESAGQEQEYEEGCLSVPGYRDLVSRPDKVKIQAQTIKGESFVVECEGLLAVCIQHEMDHLEGKLFVDYLSSLKRQRIKKKLEKAHKLQTG